MPDLAQARAWYPRADYVHGYDHMLRVYRLAESIASELGAELEIVRAAALFHDAVPPPDVSNTKRSHHHHAAADFAQEILSQEGWSPERINAVRHAIQAHRFRNPAEAPNSLEAQVLFDADKIDAIGAIGVTRALAYALNAHQPVYAPPSPEFLHTGILQSNEPHSAYHEYVIKLVRIKARLYTDPGRRLAADRHALMCTFFEQLAREFNGTA